MLTVPFLGVLMEWGGGWGSERRRERGKVGEEEKEEDSERERERERRIERGREGERRRERGRERGKKRERGGERRRKRGESRGKGEREREWQRGRGRDRRREKEGEREEKEGGGEREEKEGGGESSVFLFLQGHESHPESPTLRTSSKPSHLPKAPSPNNPTWGFRLQHPDVEGTSVQPIREPQAAQRFQRGKQLVSVCLGLSCFQY